MLTAPPRRVFAEFLAPVSRGQFRADSAPSASSAFCHSPLSLSSSTISFTLFHPLSPVVCPSELCPVCCLHCPGRDCHVESSPGHCDFGSPLVLQSETRTHWPFPVCPSGLQGDLHRGASRVPAFGPLLETSPDDRPSRHFYLWPFGFSRK